MAMRRDWAPAFRSLQIILIVAVFALDLAHGIRLGVHDVGFHPIYRVRQSMAVAISRLREPPLGGYLAYQSVLDALNRHGFAIHPQDAGPPPDVERWTALLTDADALERALQEAMTTPLDTALRPRVIIINELAYADYMYLGFRLFGVHMSSLYYLYFALLGLSCLLFVTAFGRSPFLIFVLTVYLAGLFFLQNYAAGVGNNQAVSLANSRLFEALALLPAFHVFLAVWERAPLRWRTFVGIAVQAALLVFLVLCRTTVWWQVGLILAASAGLALARGAGRWRAVWPAAITVILLVTYLTAINTLADARYATEPKAHVIWHEVLIGLVGASPELQRLYLGEAGGIDFPDAFAYAAVVRDLNARDDRSSPIAFMQDGRIDIDASVNDNEYERLQRAMAFKIIREHPFAVAAGMINKYLEQARMYAQSRAMPPGALGGAALIVAVGAFVWIMTGGGNLPPGAVRRGAAATVMILAFSTAPVAIEPSIFSVGTLLCFLVAACIAVTILIAAAVRRMRPIAAAPGKGREL
jgi:hypothetical protein